MQPQKLRSWIDLAELKDQLIRKLGLERSKQYFDYLNMFLSLKLSKIEFDKLCLRTIGRDNISLHNQLIRSILKNSCTRKAPPQTHDYHSTTDGNKKSNGDILQPCEGKVGILLHAPLGIPHCQVSKRGARRGTSVLDSDGLIETIRLRERMDQIASAQDLRGVSIDCANLLNRGLDVYLKGLIRAFAELNRARSGLEPTKNNSIKHQLTRPINGVRPGSHHQIQTRSMGSNPIQEHEPKRAISLLDFKVAMELDPTCLGEDWPVLMEKICTRAFEE